MFRVCGSRLLAAHVSLPQNGVDLPAPPRHQLGCLLLTEDAAALTTRLEHNGYLRPLPERDAGWVPGDRTLFPDGFAGARIIAFDHEQFVSSGQGGFRVWCPVDARNATARFVPALEAWRRGGARSLACGCGGTHDLTALTYRPDCGFAKEWLEFSDVGAAELVAPDALLEGVRVIWRRG